MVVRNLAAGYGRDCSEPVLAGLDFTIEPGTCLAIVGQSGCGKSTLLHTLAGLLPPLAGEVVINGAVIATVRDDPFSGMQSHDPRWSRPGHAAYMFQQDLLLPWKRVLENVTFAAEVAGAAIGRREAKAELRARGRVILQEFGLGDALRALPRELSGGMRQRVALARTLLMRRGLVLLDEPFGSLDTLTRAEMQRWLLEVMRAHPATWVVVTHDLREAALLGDHLLTLAGRPASEAGQNPVRETPESRNGLFRAFEDMATVVENSQQCMPASALFHASARLSGTLRSWR